MQLQSPGAQIVRAPDTTVEIVVISLASAAARRASVEAMFSGTGLTWSFYDAQRGLDPDLSYDVATVKRRFGRTLSPPEIGVYSSHYAVLKRFLETGTADYVLVLEDDCILDTAFPLHELAELSREHGIGYMRLFGKHYAKATRVGFFYDRSIVRFQSSPAGTQGYLMSKAAARRFIETGRSVEATIDLALDRFWETGIALFSVFPYPIIERFVPTSIPMQPYEGALDARGKLTWTLWRIAEKGRKVLANLRLARADRAMLDKGRSFQQIV